MRNRDYLREKRANLRLKILSKFRKIQAVSIPEIPTERTLFPNTENDYWYKVETPDFLDATFCIYELDKDSVFDPHYHDKNTEQIIMLTPNSKIEVVTDKKEFELSFPSGAFFNKKVPHAVINKSGFKIELLVMWKPKMLGWNANFLEASKEIEIV